VPTEAGEHSANHEAAEHVDLLGQLAEFKAKGDSMQKVIAVLFFATDNTNETWIRPC